MQSQQPEYSPAAQAHGAGDAIGTGGGDAWSRSAGLVIVAIAVVGVLLVGALLLTYFGIVQSNGATEVVALQAVDAPAPEARPAAPEVPPPAAVAEPTPPVAPAPLDARVAVPALFTGAPSATVEPKPPATALAPRTPAPVRVPAATRVAAPVSAPPTDVAVKAESTAPAPVDAVLPVPSPVTDATRPAAVETAASPPAVRADGADTPAAVVLRPIARPQPQFPRQALLDGVTRGRVVAQVKVATDGHVSAVAIISSNPPRLFDRAVQNALADWRFEPIPRPGTAQIEIAFSAE